MNGLAEINSSERFPANRCFLSESYFVCKTKNIDFMHMMLNLVSNSFYEESVGEK